MTPSQHWHTKTEQWQEQSKEDEGQEEAGSTAETAREDANGSALASADGGVQVGSVAARQHEVGRARVEHASQPKRGGQERELGGGRGGSGGGGWRRRGRGGAETRLRARSRARAAASQTARGSVRALPRSGLFPRPGCRGCVRVAHAFRRCVGSGV
eukprot:2886681-Rhodomonas_salina.1